MLPVPSPGRWKGGLAVRPTRREFIAAAAGVAAASGCQRGGRMAGHVVLLGDSILDNKAYVGQGPAVIDQVREQMPSGWKATLLAVDGSVTAGVARQFERL